jgi:hypothetical protein
MSIELLRSVLCNPEGKCCIAGSDADRAAVDRALAALEAERRLWTDARAEQLTTLVSLLREASSLNSASHVAQRILRIVDLAESLDRFDFSRENESFRQFLQRLCINARSR